MAITSRAGWALGLGVLGVAGLVGVSYGQGDGEVRKAATNAGATGAARMTPAVMGSIDLEAIFRSYEKSKFLLEGLKADGLAKEGQLKQIMAEAKQMTTEMQTFQPGTKDFKDREAKFTQLKANLQALKESAEREGQAKYAEIMATFYKEVQSMTERVAKSKGITYVVRISNEPVNSQDPEGVMAAMARPVVYADPGSDLTKTVVYNLNLEYKGPIAKNPAGAAETGEADPAAAAPAPSTRPAPKAATPRPSPGSPR